MQSKLVRACRLRRGERGVRALQRRQSNKKFRRGPRAHGEKLTEINGDGPGDYSAQFSEWRRKKKKKKRRHYAEQYV